MFHFSRWLRQTFRGPAGKSRRLGSHRRPRVRPRLEQLEDRMVFSAWTPIGPAPINNGQTAGFNPVSGRVTGVAADPGSPDTIYLATAGGGVWKTTNATSSSPTWNPLTDHLTDGNGNPLPEFMGAIAETRDIRRNQIVYAGMGEANNAPLSGSADTFYGEGILVSRNGGATWTLTDAGGALNGRTVARIAIDPSDPTGATAYAAVSENGVNGVSGGAGIWKTTNFGANWMNTTEANGLYTVVEWCDVVIDPHTPRTVYAAEGSPWGDPTNGVYQSTDGGTTWKLLTNGPRGSNAGRIALAVYDDGTTNELLASVATPFSETTGAGGQLYEVVKSLDGGGTFTVLSSVPDYLNGQGFYDTTLAIDPTDPNYIYAAGCMNSEGPTFSGSPIESFDGGQTWTDITTDRTGNGPHTDAHAVAFDHNGNLLDGNDGGIWRLNSPTDLYGQTWDDLNTNLQITQFTGIAVDPTTTLFAYGGSQDNGTEKYTGLPVIGLGPPGWYQIQPGDGGITRLDPTNPNTVYQEFYGVNLQVSFDAGTTFSPITAGIQYNTTSTGFENVNFYAPYVLDASGNVYYGSDYLNFSSDQGTTWSQIGTPGTNNFNPTDAPIDAIAVAPSDNNIVYVSAGGGLFVTTDAQSGSPVWAERDLPEFVHAGGRNSIAVDPSDFTGGTAYAAVNRFTGGGYFHVWKTTDFGNNWTDISGNLPDTPCDSVAVSQDGQTVYVGTDVGVYSTSDGGTYWAPFGAGLPNAQVVELEDVPGQYLLAAGTHGRGMWEIPTNLTNLTLHLPTAGFTEGMGITSYTVAEFTDTTLHETANNFTATVTWGDGGYTVFPAWGSIVSEGGGAFALVVPYTAYAEEGTYTLTVQVLDSSGASLSDSTTVAVADAPLYNLKISAPPASEGAGFSGFTIATFTDFNPGASKSDFTATVTWGDGSTTTLSGAAGSIVSLGNGNFAVLAGHTYADEGTYSLSVQVFDDGGAPVSGSQTIAVSDAALTHLVLPVPPPTEGLGTGTVTVATFHDYNLGAAAGDFTATIAWGDESTTTVSRFGARIVSLGNGNFALLANHTYAEEATYTLGVQVSDEGGSGISAMRLLSVGDAPLGSLQIVANPTEGVGTVTVATFHDANTPAPAANFTATIAWGDGTTSPVSGSGIVALGGGNYALLSSHTYAEEGPCTLTVQVLDDGGASISGTGKVAVADAPLASLKINDPKATEGTGFPYQYFTLATFIDPNTSAPATDFTATVSWGDGSTSTLSGTSGSIVAEGGGLFVLAADHTYSEEGPRTVAVQILDHGGASISGNLTIAVADAALSGLSIVNLGATEGKGTGTFTVATFLDKNASAPATDFTATVTWSDGATTTLSGTGGGIVSLGGGQFALRSSHTYAEEGNYTLSVQVRDDGAASISGSLKVAVADAALANLSITKLAATEGKATGTIRVVTFHDSNLGAPATDFTATITWGDGTTTVSGATGGLISLGNGYFGLNAGHTYAEEGNYTVSVQVRDDGGASAAGSLGISVADTRLISVGVANLHATEGQGTGPVTVATFTDANATAPATDFTAVVNWGDGITTTVSGSGIAVLGGGNFAVRSSHTYAEERTATLSVQVRDDGGASTSGSRTIPVGDASLGKLAINNPNATAGTSTGTFTMATFHDAYTGAPLSDFTAAIKWGDGSNSTVTKASGGLVALGSGNFAVRSSHTYGAAGTFTLAVKVADVGGSSVSGSKGIHISSPLAPQKATPVAQTSSGGDLSSWSAAPNDLQLFQDTLIELWVLEMLYGLPPSY
jgi:hypothetical protein